MKAVLIFNPLYMLHAESNGPEWVRGVGYPRDRGGAGFLFPLTRYGGLDRI